MRIAIPYEEGNVFQHFGKSKQFKLYTVENGKIVTFTNTVYGYERLVDRKVDIMIAARPSDSQKEYAAQKIEQIETLPIAEEAFVFFVEESNPVRGLTSEQIRAIYHGDITNWKEVGGPDLKIIAFQRPENSGSQVMMKYFMGDVSLKEPERSTGWSRLPGISKTEHIRQRLRLWPQNCVPMMILMSG